VSDPESDDRANPDDPVAPPSAPANVPAPADSTAPSFWSTPRAWLLLVAGGLIAWIYRPLFFPESHQALAIQSEEFFFEANEAAGAPVLLLTAWLVYRRSHYLDVFRSGGALLPGSGLLAASVALYGWGHYTGAPDLQLMSLIPLLFGVVVSLGGSAAARAFWVPIAFLGFALPIPPVLLSAAIFPVQLMTAEYAGTILNLIGVKSMVSGDMIFRPENSFIVIETCSGVRTAVTLTMLTVLLIDLFERRGKHAAILLLLVPLVAFATNGLRVVSLVLNPHSSVASIHNLQGIMMLLVGLTGIYLLDLALEKALGSAEPGADAEAYGRVARAEGAQEGLLAPGLAVVALVAIVVIPRAIVPYVPATGLAERPEALIDRAFPGAPSQEIPPDFEFRGSIRYLAHHDRAIRFEGRQVNVFLGVANEIFRTHTILSPRLAWPRAGWFAIEDDEVDLADDALGVRRVLLERSGRQELSYSWYLRAGSLPVEWLRQALALERSPFEREEHILAVRISVPLARGETDLKKAEQRARRAWRQLAPELEGYAPLRGGRKG
ncbi:unnamed protein product, partial [Discosporangium mesarthrocarpum]